MKHLKKIDEKFDDNPVEQNDTEKIVADIRNKLQPIVTYFQLLNYETDKDLSKIIKQAEEQSNISLPIIIQQLKNLVKLNETS